MALFRNTDVQARVWPHLSHEGHTLSLDAGETADLDVPDDFSDVWLKPEPEPTEPEPKARRAAPKAETPTPDATDVAETKE